MNWIYVAHTPYVVMFLLFTVALIGGAWAQRRKP